MASRAAIEEQIRLLNEQLVASTAYDPEFTPIELVRWNPDLIGTVLHCEHTPHKFNIHDFGWDGLFAKAEVFGIVTDKGILTSVEPIPEHKKEYPVTFKKEEIYNSFISITKFKCELRTYTSAPEHYDNYIKTKCLDATIERIPDNCKPQQYIGLLNLTLVPVSQSILDHIYVTSIITLPHSENPQIVHKYPLSHLYKKWKQEKDSRKPTAEPEDPHTKP